MTHAIGLAVRSSGAALGSRRRMPACSISAAAGPATAALLASAAPNRGNEMRDVKCPYCSEDVEINHDDGADHKYEQAKTYPPKFTRMRCKDYGYETPLTPNV